MTRHAERPDGQTPVTQRFISEHVLLSDFQSENVALQDTWPFWPVFRREYLAARGLLTRQRLAPFDQPTEWI